mmetsp:Transcript_21926/g.21119  ORF Transcript_21926/g.21119 Transcript_21926/m.21119 type:complete len:118 (+) Transcript_21926:774-1127(+)
MLFLASITFTFLPFFDKETPLIVIFSDILRVAPIITAALAIHSEVILQHLLNLLLHPILVVFFIKFVFGAFALLPFLLGPLDIGLLHLFQDQLTDLLLVILSLSLILLIVQFLDELV